jgi:hypothetical protein
MDIIEYTQKHTIQGACQCGNCIDLSKNTVLPAGPHTIDMEIFKVAITGEPNKDEYLTLMAEHKGHHCDCNPVDGNEHGYIELGGWIGDQGLAMMFMALGVYLGVFKLMTPSTMLPPCIPDSLKKMMIERGMICVQKAA